MPVKQKKRPSAQGSAKVQQGGMKSARVSSNCRLHTDYLGAPLPPFKDNSANVAQPRYALNAWLNHLIDFAVFFAAQ